MKYPFILVLILVLFTAFPVSALDTYQAGTDVDLKIPVRIDGAVNPNLVCNLTVLDPEGIVIVDFKQMTNQLAYHNYTIPKENTTSLGIYNDCFTCTGNGLNATQCDQFEITHTGTEVSTQQGIFYSILFVVSIFLLILNLYGAIRIPGNKMINDPYLPKISLTKYAKMACVVFSYFLLVWLIFLAWQMSLAFFYVDFVSQFLFILYMILLIISFPTMILATFWVIYTFITDKSWYMQLQRGVNIR